MIINWLHLIYLISTSSAPLLLMELSCKLPILGTLSAFLSTLHVFYSIRSNFTSVFAIFRYLLGVPNEIDWGVYVLVAPRSHGKQSNFLEIGGRFLLFNPPTVSLHIMRVKVDFLPVCIILVHHLFGPNSVYQH
jgi:hypothetical protein